MEEARKAEKSLLVYICCLTIGVLEFGMNIQEAVEAVKYRTGVIPEAFFPHAVGRFEIEWVLGEEVLEALKAKGYDLIVRAQFGIWNSNQAIVIDYPNPVVLLAGASPTGEAYA